MKITKTYFLIKLWRFFRKSNINIWFQDAVPEKKYIVDIYFTMNPGDRAFKKKIKSINKYNQVIPT